MDVRGETMKCFKCGSLCRTNYILDYAEGREDKIQAVQKVCNECSWKSYPTKVPSPLTR